jgi:hypothetical protein
LKPPLNLEQTEPEHIGAGKNNTKEGTIQRKEQYTRGGIIYKERNNI